MRRYIVRGVDINNCFIFVLPYQFDSRIVLYERVAGVDTNRGNFGTVTVGAATYEFNVVENGSNLEFRAYRNGVEQGSAIILTAAGRPAGELVGIMPGYGNQPITVATSMTVGAP
jgi:hypothetical protein